MGRITLETPTGRRIDLTVRGWRERWARSASLAVAILGSLFLWAIVLWPWITLLIGS